MEESNVILKEFSKRFSQLVQDSNTDIPLLTKTLGIKSLSTIYRYMNGSMSPKISTVKCIADLFEVNPIWLMGYDVPMNKENKVYSIFRADNEADNEFFKGYKSLSEDEKQVLRNTLSIFLKNKGGKNG